MQISSMFLSSIIFTIFLFANQIVTEDTGVLDDIFLKDYWEKTLNKQLNETSIY